MRDMLASLDTALADMPRQIGRTPKAVLMITAHWEERAFTLGSNPAPGMVYDYGGFPAHTYSVVYSAPGAPELALAGAGIAAGSRLAGGTGPSARLRPRHFLCPWP